METCWFVFIYRLDAQCRRRAQASCVLQSSVHVRRVECDAYEHMILLLPISWRANTVRRRYKTRKLQSIEEMKLNRTHLKTEASFTIITRKLQWVTLDRSVSSVIRRIFTSWWHSEMHVNTVRRRPTVRKLHLILSVSDSSDRRQCRAANHQEFFRTEDWRCPENGDWSFPTVRYTVRKTKMSAAF